MDNFADLVSAVQTDLSIDNTSTLFTPDVIKLALNRSYRKCAGLFKWPMLKDSQKASAVANQEYYDYPETWQYDSAWKLTVDGQDYGDPLAFRDYRFEIENNFPSHLIYFWTVYGGQYFIYPVPTLNGNNNIIIWGYGTVSKLVNTYDTTIFTTNFPECNDAIVLEAEGILKAKGEDQNTSLFKSADAKNLLAIAWGKIQENQTKYEKTTPFFEVPDFFPDRKPGNSNTSNGSPIANF